MLQPAASAGERGQKGSRAAWSAAAAAAVAAVAAAAAAAAAVVLPDELEGAGTAVTGAAGRGWCFSTTESASVEPGSTCSNNPHAPWHCQHTC
jgi:hypothetical protein